MYNRSYSMNKIAGRYFYVPNKTISNNRVMTSSQARHITKVSKGLLRCRKGYILLVSSEAVKRELITDYHKEYQFIKEGKLACMPPASRYRISQYQKQQRINSDPRVVAARIQANNANVARMNNVKINPYIPPAPSTYHVYHHYN